MADYTLEGVLQKAVRAQLGDLEIGLPAVVDAYDAEAQTARVRPAVGELPAIGGVPVLFPAGGGFGLTWPLAPGDSVWLVFSGRAFRGWLAGAERETSRQRFAIGECAVLPQSPLKAAASASSRLILGEATGAQVRIGQGRVGIGTQAVELLDVLDTALEALQSATVATAAGPQPLDPVTQGTLEALRLALAQIMEV